MENTRVVLGGSGGGIPRERRLDGLGLLALLLLALRHPGYQDAIDAEPGVPEAGVMFAGSRDAPAIEVASSFHLVPASPTPPAAHATAYAPILCGLGLRTADPTSVSRQAR